MNAFGSGFMDLAGARAGWEDAPISFRGQASTWLCCPSVRFVGGPDQAATLLILAKTLGLVY